MECPGAKIKMNIERYVFKTARIYNKVLKIVTRNRVQHFI